MTTTEEIVNAIAQLSDSDKRRLVDEIWRMLPDDDGLTPEELTDLERRLALCDEHPDKGQSWEITRRELESER